jgi:hypothetical protein
MEKQRAKTATRTSKASIGERKKPTSTYEPPRLTKFEKLEKLIVCGE